MDFRCFKLDVSLYTFISVLDVFCWLVFPTQQTHSDIWLLDGFVNAISDDDGNIDELSSLECLGVEERPENSCATTFGNA
jgi:hypothetical protein